LLTKELERRVSDLNRELGEAEKKIRQLESPVAESELRQPMKRGAEAPQPNLPLGHLLGRRRWITHFLECYWPEFSLILGGANQPTSSRENSKGMTSAATIAIARRNSLKMPSRCSQFLNGPEFDGDPRR